jgi:hypothetical protein
MKINNIAQNLVEYAIIIGVVAAALMAMQLYFKRGVQSIAKISVDQLAGFGTGDFSPEQIQEMGIEHEVDPKYGKLASYEVETKVDHKVTVKTSPKGKRELTINKWEDHVEDKDGKGKVFWQEYKE